MRLIFFILLFAAQFLNGQSILDSILMADTHAVVKKVLSNPDKYKLQIIYTRINRSTYPYSLQHYYFRKNPTEYFYPASLVKLPAAALALEKLNWVAPDHVTRKTPLYVNPKFSGIRKDTFHYPSLEENIERMLVMSDNPAFNRTYDFLGQEYIHLRMLQMGYPNARLVQRLSACTAEENRITGPYAFCDTTKNIHYWEEELYCSKKFDCPSPYPFVGTGYMDGRRKILKPKDFSESNFLPLENVHSMLISLMMPEAVSEEQRFELTDEQYRFLRKCMGAYPRECSIAEYASDTNLYDAVRKYILFGNEKGIRNDTLRTYNKVGLAYGFVSDAAYVVDQSSGCDFFVSCVLYANDNEILNDGKYEYRSIAYPFMKYLGQGLLDFEKVQKSKSTIK